MESEPSVCDYLGDVAVREPVVDVGFLQRPVRQEMGQSLLLQRVDIFLLFSEGGGKAMHPATVILRRKIPAALCSAIECEQASENVLKNSGFPCLPQFPRLLEGKEMALATAAPGIRPAFNARRDG